MPTLTSIRKAAEKRLKEEAGGGNLKDKYLQGLTVEKDLLKIDHILVNDLQFLNADGDIIEYTEPDTEAETSTD